MGRNHVFCPNCGAKNTSDVCDPPSLEGVYLCGCEAQFNFSWDIPPAWSVRAMNELAAKQDKQALWALSFIYCERDLNVKMYTDYDDLISAAKYFNAGSVFTQVQYCQTQGIIAVEFRPVAELLEGVDE